MSSRDANALARVTITGTLWNYGAFALGKGLVFVSTVLLARLLVPADFGLVALGLVVINFLDTLSDFGVGAALIYRSENPERTSSTAFTIGLMMGVLLTVAAVLGAPLAADFFREPRLVPVLQVLAVSFLITALRNVHEARLKKDLAFQRRFVPEVGRTAVKGLVSVLLAFFGFGVWSLVWGQLGGSLASTLLYWRVARWRPRLTLDREIVGALLGYGGQIVLVQILGMIHKNVDYLIIGRRLSADDLGFYFMAFRIPDLIIISLCHVVSQALFPAFARLQDDPRALKQGALAMLRYTALITVPAGIGIAVIAADFVTIFYTSRWAPSIPVMQMLALYALFQAISFNVGDIYKATGRPAVLNYLGVAKLALTIPVLWIAAGYGIRWVAVGQAATALVLTLLSLEIACRLLDVRRAEIARALRPAAMSAVAMGIVLFPLARLLPPTPAARMPALILAGATAYVATLWWTHRETVEGALALFRRDEPEMPPGKT